MKNWNRPTIIIYSVENLKKSVHAFARSFTCERRFIR